MKPLTGGPIERRGLWRVWARGGAPEYAPTFGDLAALEFQGVE
jgi:hypothetical protein